MYNRSIMSTIRPPVVYSFLFCRPLLASSIASMFPTVSLNHKFVCTIGLVIIGWRHERTTQQHVNLAKQRMQPVVYGTYRRILIYVCSVLIDSVCSNHEASVGLVQVIVSRSGQQEFDGCTRFYRRDRLTLHSLSMFDARLRCR